MSSDEEDLRSLNLTINEAENTGNRDFLASVLAPELAFLRADGKETVDDAGRFLQKANPKPAPGILTFDTTGPEPIEVIGNRAIVKCIVTQGGKRYHNLRLFVRLGGQWKLLAWGNEAL